MTTKPMEINVPLTQSEIALKSERCVRAAIEDTSHRDKAGRWERWLKKQAGKQAGKRSRRLGDLHWFKLPRITLPHRTLPGRQVHSADGEDAADAI